jgi:hypothetical protein
MNFFGQTLDLSAYSDAALVMESLLKQQFLNSDSAKRIRHLIVPRSAAQTRGILRWVTSPFQEINAFSIIGSLHITLQDLETLLNCPTLRSISIQADPNEPEPIELDVSRALEIWNEKHREVQLTLQGFLDVKQIVLSTEHERNMFSIQSRLIAGVQQELVRRGSLTVNPVVAQLASIQPFWFDQGRAPTPDGASSPVQDDGFDEFDDE